VHLRVLDKVALKHLFTVGIIFILICKPILYECESSSTVFHHENECARKALILCFFICVMMHF
jgi:hypothetical protein